MASPRVSAILALEIESWLPKKTSDQRRNLRNANALRDELTQIFDAKQTEESAQGATREWTAGVKHSDLDCFDKFNCIFILMAQDIVGLHCNSQRAKNFVAIGRPTYAIILEVALRNNFGNTSFV